MVAPKHRIDYIDGLRAVAVLAVIGAHTIWFGGAHGVDLFFVISGFCLSYPTLLKLKETGRSDFNLIDYGIKRIVRIVPPYWSAIALLVVVYLIATALRFRMPWPEMLPYGFSWQEVAKQAFFIDKHTSFLNGSFWTLSIEFRWYFIFPVALWLWIRKPLWFVALALLSIPIGLIFDAKTNLGLIDPLVLPAFLLGIVAAHVQVRNVKAVQVAALPVGVILLTITLLFPQPRVGSPICYLCAFSFVVASGYYGFLARLLSIRIIALIGLASYSIYLIHEPVIAILGRLGVWVYPCALVSVLIAFAFWWVAERPFVSGPIRRKLIGALTGLVAATRKVIIPFSAIVALESKPKTL
jgi:peptidoglycan/LPS O-acetylase OafA/YrhL